MKSYVVGGAVRDELLGLPLQDKDYVVVGATPEEMVARGFKPVGKDFPVFLHPKTHEEYALARTERKRHELERGLAEPHPEKMFEVLEAAGVADKLLDGVKPVPELLKRTAKETRSVAVRFAVIAWPHKEPEVTAVC